MATQNPIEQEGVYALPEAQLDRFMMKLVVKHNSQEEELEIMRKGASRSFAEVEKVLNIDELELIKKELENIHIDVELEKYIISLISATREPQKFNLKSISSDIMFGASPRASIDLYKASKAKAYLRGNDFVTPADIGFVVHDVLRHRVVLSYEARAKGVTADELISKVIETVPVP
jgi:MoxR-like ATPase